MSSRVRLQDVADKARVSSTTASLVLSGRAEEFRIAAVTRDAVLEAAHGLGYVRRVTQRSGRRATPPLWTLFAPSDFDSGPTRQFFDGVQGYLRENKLQVDCIVLPFERGRLEEKRHWISPDFARGAVMVGLTDEDVAFIDATEFELPIVLANRTARGCASVVVDDYSAGQQAMQHFLARGLSEFVIVSPTHTSRALSMRTIGFTDALQQVGGRASSSVQSCYADVYDEPGFAAALDALTLPTARVGFFVLNDQMVGGLTNWLQGRALVVPRDAEIISYGDSPINTVVRPPVTSLRVPSHDMSVECARTLQQAVSHRGSMTGAIRSFGTELIARESSPSLPN